MDVEPRNETENQAIEGNVELRVKRTDDNSERADSGMDEDSQHSNSNDAKSHGELESSDDEDVVHHSRKKVHRLLDDDLDIEDSRLPPDVSEENDTKTGTSLKSAEEVLDTIFKEDEDDNSGSSDSDDDTLLNTVKKKKRVAIDEVNCSEDALVKETKAQSEGAVFGNGDLFDAEDSEDERNSGDDSAKNSSSDTDDEGFDESKIDPKLLKQLKKGAAKKDPSQTARGKRKAKEEALLNMHSETQRIVREGRVQLPYHNPTPRPLKDFLGRAMRKQEQYKALKGSKSLQKVKVVQDVIEKAKFMPNKNIKDESLVQNSSDKQKETCVETQQQKSQKETEVVMTKNIKHLSEKSSDQSNIAEMVLSNVEGSGQIVADNNIDSDNDSLPDLDDKVDLPVIPAENGVESNVTSNIMINAVNCVNDREAVGEDKSRLSSESLTSALDREMVDHVCIDNQETEVDRQTNKESAKTESIDCATEVKSQTASSETCVVEQSVDILDKAATSKATLRELVPDLPFLSKMTGDPNSVIDLEDGAECSPWNPGVKKLMDRFLKHSKKKEKKVCSDVDISIIQKESGDANKQELKESTFTYHATQEEANPLMELAAPGAKLTALKSQLQVKMKARREEARQKRQEVYDLDNEEGYEAGDEVLDDEAELTDQSDTDDEEIDEFEKQFGEEEEEIEADERKEKNPFMDEEADEEDDGDADEAVGDDDDLNLRLDLSDGEDTQQSDTEEVDRSLSAKKKPKVLQISDDEEESRDETDKVDQNKDDKVEKPVPMERAADESLEDVFSPFSKHLSSMVNTQKESLSLPIEDSQDLYGASQSIPATTVVTQTQSHGIHFFMDDSQSQMLDADGFLKMGSSTKKPRKFDFVEPSGTQDNMEELLGLCSGRFAGTQAEGKKVSCKSLFGTQNVNNTQGNMEELLGMCSGRFVSSSNKESQIQSPSSKKRKLPLDDEEEIEERNTDDEFEIASNDENFEENDKEELSGDEKGEMDDDTNDDKDEVDGDATAVFSGFTVKNKHGKIRQEFVDEEAELSGSEYDSDENLDLAMEDDIMELEEGDKDVLVSDDELRNQVGRAHLKQLIDEDKRELMRFQEMYLPDGDLHSEGGGRVRKFRWRNIDDDTQQDMFGNDSDGEKEEEEGENDFKWRKERFEREKWLQEQQENEKIEDGDSQLMKFGKVFLKRRDSDSGSVPTVKKTSLEVEKQNTKKETPSTPTNFYKLSKQKRGSFLSRDKDTLAKIAEMSKPATINLKGARNSRNFVFQVISPDKEKSQQQVGPTPTIGPKIRKAHSAKPSQKPVAKKPRLEEKSFSQNSIFHHM